jgi:hypothetical protein
MENRLLNTRKSDSPAKVVELLKAQDSLFQSDIALANAAEGKIPTDLLEAVKYRGYTDAKLGFETQMAGREAARYKTAIDNDAKYNVNPKSRFVPTEASVY